MWRIIEWGRNVQIQFSAAVHCFHLCASCISCYAAVYLPFRSSQLCELSSGYAVSNAYAIMTRGIVDSVAAFLSLCCRDPRNSGFLPPDSASDPILQANKPLSYYKPCGKVCSTLTATRNCCSECKACTLDLLWVDVSVFHVYDWIEWNSKLMLSSFLRILSLVFLCQPTESMLKLSWYILIWTCTG